VRSNPMNLDVKPNMKVPPA